MKKQIVILGIAILLIVVGLSGCFNSDNSELNKFIGKWKHGTIQDDIIIEFLSNGKGIYQGNSVEWEIKDGKLVVDFTDRDIILTFDYEFLNNNQILILTELETGQVDDYIKQ